MNAVSTHSFRATFTRALAKSPPKLAWLNAPSGEVSVRLRGRHVSDEWAWDNKEAKAPLAHWPPVASDDTTTSWSQRLAVKITNTTGVATMPAAEDNSLGDQHYGVTIAD